MAKRQKYVMNKTQIMSEKTFKSFKYMKISALNE